MGKLSYKIYSLMVVKNEADIIEASLLDALRWSDKLIVIDNGSSDGTWEKIQQLSQTHKQIVAFLRYEGPFHIGLRAKAFRAFRHEMRWGDWWCVRLDADELFTQDVRQVLDRVPFYCNLVKKESTDYIITKEDIEEKHFTQNFLNDRPLITSYLPERRKERRFMRHSPFLVWLERWRYPHPWLLTAKTTVAVEHFQYRSPEQMEKRFLTRQQAKADGCGSFHHEKGKQWQDYLLSRSELHKQEMISNISRYFSNETNVIHTGRNTLKVIENDWVVKSFEQMSFVNRLIYGTIRKSKAERSYQYAKLLGQLTPEPIAYKDIRRHGLLRESYYISRKSTLPYTFRMLERDPHFPQREQHIAALARLTAQLHERGILHGDYSGGNILFDDNDNFQLVDLNRLTFKHSISMRQGCRNFERLNLSNDEYAIIGREYAAARGFSRDTCIHLIQQMRWKKHRNK